MDGPVALISLLSFSTIVAALYDPVLQARLGELNDTEKCGKVVWHQGEKGPVG